MAERQRADALIIGAGYAGLSAAVELVDNGLSVAVVEARERVGGRAFSRSESTGGIDLGATWFWSNEPLVRSLAGRFEQAVFEQRIDGDALLEVPDEQGAVEVRRIGGNPVDAPAARFTGGAQELARRMAANLPAGSIRLGEPVESVVLPEGADSDVDVSTASTTYSAASVVVAVPPPVAASTIAFAPGLPATVRAAADSIEVWMSGMVKAVAVYDEDFWHPNGLAAAAISHAGPFREFHDHSGPKGPAAVFGFAPSRIFGSMTEQEIAEVFCEQLGRLLGVRAASPASVHVVDWSRESFTCPSPGPLRDTRGYGAREFQEPIADRLHWASTETADAFAGHLEGAVRAGLRAAREILGRR